MADRTTQLPTFPNLGMALGGPSPYVPDPYRMFGPPLVTDIPGETPQQKLAREMTHGAPTGPVFRHQQIPTPVLAPGAQPTFDLGFGMPPPGTFVPPTPATPAAPDPLSFLAPFISAPETQVEVPEAPGRAPLTAPTGPDPVDKLSFVLQAISQAGIDPNSPMGFNILRMGLAGLGGLRPAEEAEKRGEEEYQRALEQFETQQAAAQQQEFQNQLAVQGFLLEQEEAARAGREAEIKQLTPGIKGGYLLQPTLLEDEEGKQVKTEILPLPTKKGETTELIQQLISSQAKLNPQATYQALLSTPQGAAAVDWASEQLELPPQTAGIEWSEQDRTKISQYIQTNEPELFNTTVTPYLDLTAGIQALGKRPIK